MSEVISATIFYNKTYYNLTFFDSEPDRCLVVGSSDISALILGFKFMICFLARANRYEPNIYQA